MEVGRDVASSRSGPVWADSHDYLPAAFDEVCPDGPAMLRRVSLREFTSEVRISVCA